MNKNQGFALKTKHSTFSAATAYQTIYLHKELSVQPDENIITPSPLANSSVCGVLYNTGSCFTEL